MFIILFIICLHCLIRPDEYREYQDAANARIRDLQFQVDSANSNLCFRVTDEGVRYIEVDIISVYPLSRVMIGISTWPSWNCLRVPNGRNDYEISIETSSNARFRKRTRLDIPKNRNHELIIN